MTNYPAHCPKCFQHRVFGCTNRRFINGHWRVTFDGWHCPNCKHEWMQE